jgi:hypothetical protein
MIEVVSDALAFEQSCGEFALVNPGNHWVFATTPG